jgi:hypothetical protein
MLVGMREGNAGDGPGEQRPLLAGAEQFRAPVSRQPICQ